MCHWWLAHHCDRAKTAQTTQPVHTPLPTVGCHPSRCWDGCHRAKTVRPTPPVQTPLPAVGCHPSRRWDGCRSRENPPHLKTTPHPKNQKPETRNQEPAPFKPATPSQSPSGSPAKPAPTLPPHPTPSTAATPRPADSQSSAKIDAQPLVAQAVPAETSAASATPPQCPPTRPANSAKIPSPINQLRAISPPLNPSVCSTACSRTRSCTDKTIVFATSASTTATQPKLNQRVKPISSNKSPAARAIKAFSPRVVVGA